MKTIRLTEEGLKHLIIEELSKSDIVSIAKSECNTSINSNDFKKKVKEIATDVLSNLFKSLWQQNNIWKRTCQQ